jgi:hypothetical protein
LTFKPSGCLTCLWHTVFGPQKVQVVLLRDTATRGFGLALVTTGLHASPAQVIERYAARWPIEAAAEDARQIFGAGQARNRVAGAVRRTLPFTLTCQTLATIWYATSGYHPDDVTARRLDAPWYRTRTGPSTAGMIAKLRRVLSAARFQPPRPDQATPEEIHAIHLAWQTEAA